MTLVGRMAVAIAVATVTMTVGVAQEASVEQRALVRQVCPPCGPISRAQRGAESLGAALVDRKWAVGPRGVNAEAWWDEREDAGNLPGYGTTIVQIDTGYTSHPLLHYAGSSGGVDFGGADGLFGAGYQNRDTLRVGFLRFPGHGTKTASVIAARTSVCQSGL